MEARLSCKQPVLASQLAAGSSESRGRVGEEQEKDGIQVGLWTVPALAD